MQCTAKRFYAVAHIGEAMPVFLSQLDRETCTIVGNRQAHLLWSLL